MKKILLIFLLFIVGFSSSAFANLNPYKKGDIVENEVVYGQKIRFPLPPGKFEVGVVFREREFHDTMLYQFDESGVVRWSIHVYSTGRTDWLYWNPGKFCKRSDVYFIKKKIANKKFSCWMVNHTRSDITAEKGFWKRVRAYEVKNKFNFPDIMVYSKHEYSKGSKLTGSSYFYNPELDGIPPSNNKEWATNEFHVQRVHQYPEHEKFLNKFKSISASLVSRFNKLNKVKGALTLNAEGHITEASIDLEKQKDSTSTSSNDIVETLSKLKELLDSGALTKEEFEKAKKKILNK